MGLKDFLDANAVEGVDEAFIRAMDTVGEPLVRAAVKVAPAQPDPAVNMAPVAVAIAAPHDPPLSAPIFMNLIAVDIALFILAPLKAGAISMSTPAAVGLLPPPIVAALSPIGLAILPPNPKFSRAVLEWAVSLVPPADLRVLGGFVVL